MQQIARKNAVAICRVSFIDRLERAISSVISLSLKKYIAFYCTSLWQDITKSHGE